MKTLILIILLTISPLCFADTFLGEDVYTPPSWTVSNTPRDMLVVIYPTEPVNINVEGVDINAKETKNNEYIVLNQNIINFEGPF